MVRNRVRRRIREALRVMAPSFQPGWDVLIIARPAIVEADHDALVGALTAGPPFGRRARRSGGDVKRIGVDDRGGAHPPLPHRVRAGCRRAAGSNPPARATPSRRSRSTGCCAGPGWAPSASADVTPGTRAATTRSADLAETTPRDAPPARPSSGSRRSCCSSASRCSSPRARRWAAPRAAARRGLTPTPSQAPLTPATPGREPDRACWRGCSRRSSRPCSSGWCSSTRRPRSSGPNGNIVIAIILLTIVIRVLVIPLYRRQLVSTRQMQLIQPEIKELQRKYKGDRVKAAGRGRGVLQGQRGINPAGGCLPIVLQFGPADPDVLGHQPGPHQLRPERDVARVRDRPVPRASSAHPAPMFNAAGHVINPCLNPVAFGDQLGPPGAVPRPACYIAGFGISILAIISSLVPAGRVADDAPGRRPQERRPEHEAPAADGLLPAADLDPVRRRAAGGPVHLLDHGDADPDRPAVPDPRLGRDVPAVRLVPGVRAQPHAALPGEDPGAQAACPGQTDERGGRARKPSTGTSPPNRRSGPTDQRSGRRGRRR